MGVMRISAHSLTSDVGIGSRSHDLGGDDFRILSSFLGQRCERVFLVGLGLVTKDGIDGSYFEDFVIEELTESVRKVGFICVVR